MFAYRQHKTDIKLQALRASEGRPGSQGGYSRGEGGGGRFTPVDPGDEDVPRK